MVRELGEIRWYVSLGNKIVVVPEDKSSQQANWLTWESITVALEKLKFMVVFPYSSRSLEGYFYLELLLSVDSNAPIF